MSATQARASGAVFHVSRSQDVRGAAPESVTDVMPRHGLGARDGLALPQRRAPFRIAHILMKRIGEGQYPQGGWMPIEVELFFDLKISRTVLREAFIVLECLGLVEAHAGVGWRIIGRAPTPLARFPSSLDAVAMLEAGSFFEAEAVALTATIGHQVLPKPVPLKARPTLEDCEAFHVQLAQGAENPAIALSIRNIWQVSLQRPAIRRVLSGALSQVSAHLPDLQTQVIDAVRARHPDVARAAMKRLFHAYLCGVVDFEAEEQLMQASKEHLQNRQTWRERLGSGLSQDFTAP